MARAAFDQGAPQSIQYILALQRTTGPIEHRAISRRCRPPIHTELPCDGAKLRRLHDDASAGARPGTQDTVGIGARILEQI